MGDRLTPNERLVLREIMAGATTADICERLAIKTSTLKWHLRNLFQKTGARNRQALAAWGWRQQQQSGEVS